jgi:ATP-dependent RNA helicase SUPV3L1/SUV3
MPALLKPAPRSLAAQLWMLKHESPEAKGLDELQRLAASGRTSIPVDKDAPKALYRSIGYRVCGERAIRVDILERLADLIRPALAWREGSPGAKPPGAFNGFGFLVTGAMTSLTGASGEDFASILRSLGYRMEKRPKPPEPAIDTETTAEPQTAAAEPSPSDRAAAETGPAEPTVAEAEPTEIAPALAPDAEPAVNADAAAEPAAETDAAIEAVETERAATDAAASPETGSEASASTETSAEAAPAAPTEPALLEVWRPGRPPGERRPRDGERRRRRQHERAPARAEPASSGEAAAGSDQTAVPASEVASGQNQEGRERRGRPHRRRREATDVAEGQRPERADRTQRRERAEQAEHRSERGERPGRRDRSPRRDRRDDDRPSRTWSSTQEPRSKEPDPNSPFAKLLALKEQLEANKERH